MASGTELAEKAEKAIAIKDINGKSLLNKEAVLIGFGITAVADAVTEWLATGEPINTLPGVIIAAVIGFAVRSKVWSNSSVGKLLGAYFTCENCDTAEVSSEGKHSADYTDELDLDLTDLDGIPPVEESEGD